MKLHRHSIFLSIYLSIVSLYLLSHTHSLSHTLTHSLSHTHTLSLTLSLTHTLSRTSFDFNDLLELPFYAFLNAGAHAPADTSTRQRAAALQRFPAAFLSSLAPSQSQFEMAQAAKTAALFPLISPTRSTAAHIRGSMPADLRAHSQSAVTPTFISPRQTNRILHSYSDNIDDDTWAGAGAGAGAGARKRGGKLGLRVQVQSVHAFSPHSPRLPWAAMPSARSPWARAGAETDARVSFVE